MFHALVTTYAQPSSTVSDALGTCVSSIILCLRTHAVWGQEKKIGIPLAALSLGQIAMWAQTFRYSVTRWDPKRNACVTVSTAPQPLLVAVFAYSKMPNFPSVSSGR
jgi:hypothetical protein